MIPFILVVAALAFVLYFVKVPAGISNSVLIERPLTQVFAFVTNPENIPRWNTRVTSVRLLSPGPAAPGSSWELDLGPITLRYTMTALEPDMLMAAETRNRAMSNHYEYRFSAEDGQTQLTVRSSAHVPLIQAITIRLIGRARSSGDLGRIKTTLEGA